MKYNRRELRLGNKSALSSPQPELGRITGQQVRSCTMNTNTEASDYTHFTSFFVGLCKCEL